MQMDSKAKGYSVTSYITTQRGGPFQILSLSFISKEGEKLFSYIPIQRLNKSLLYVIESDENRDISLLKLVGRTKISLSTPFDDKCHSNMTSVNSKTLDQLK